MDARLENFKIAKELNEEYRKLLRTKKLHFRGNSGSFSLISLSKETPELGKGGFKSKNKGKEFLDKVTSPKFKWKLPKRPIREKELQAWIINYALNHGNKMPFGENLKFITSEMSLMKGKKKIVNDILAIDGNNDLVVIELKSKRLKKELEMQVEQFNKLIMDSTNTTLFEGLVKLLTNRNWSGKTRGMVVWPHAKNSPLATWEHGIKEICYYEKEYDGKKTIVYDKSGNIRF